MIPWTDTVHIVDLDTEIDSPDRAFERLAGSALFRAMFDSISDGLLLLDRSGRVLYLNSRGEKYLGLEGRPCIGLHVSAIVDFRPVVLDVLESGKGYLEREIYIQSPSRGKLRFLKSAVVLKDKKARILGVIDTFKPLSSLGTIAPKAFGSPARYGFSDIIGRQPVLLEAVNLSRIAAQSDANVLIEGESGTGKEMFAHAIHQASHRSKAPFVIVNCASLPPSLIESELFGYEAGAFTGARKEGYRGKFEQASGGTIFLDEIAEIPLDMQAKLLRVLQDRSFSRIGGTSTITVDIRVIAATNKKLREEMGKGRFREDLYYRLDVLCIRPPPLRERLDDIPLLASHFAMKCSLHHGKAVPELGEDVLAALREYPWPGNVRELENVIERAIIVSENGRIAMSCLPNYIINNLPHTGREAAEPPRACHDLESMERNEIRKALEESESNISACAKRLAISRNTLYRKMKKYCL
ncbi:MAG TPA: sigma 54-interacting transcriptional regulator [Rectinemataceae bacterium]